jgi:hypothetical protein
MLLREANSSGSSLPNGSPTAGPGLQADIDSGNLNRLVLKNSYQTGLELPKLCSDRAVHGMDDDLPLPKIGNA